MLTCARNITGFVILICCFACTPRHSQSEIVTAMRAYDRLITKMDADSIALLYAKDGELGRVAKGRDSIRHFLQSFHGVRVLSNESRSSSINLSGDSARQTGSYHQDAILSDGDTVHLKGTFACQWIWVPQEGWRIKKMETSPSR